MHRLSVAVQTKDSTVVTISDLKASLAQATTTAEQLPAAQLALRYTSASHTAGKNNS